jgi:tRNA A37 threonylcarbamoyltransferase TsaD
LAKKYQKKLLAINHLRDISIQFLRNNSREIRHTRLSFLFGVIVSGGHTELVLMKEHLHYEV